MKKLLMAGAAAATLAVYAPLALAHPHNAEPAHQGDGQALANGQNHAPFSSGVTCGGDPAAYGLETAHHGPDAGTPGKGAREEREEGGRCYQTTGGVPPGQDDQNPAIG